LCAQLAAKCVRIDVVDEGAFAVDLDHGEPVPVPRLELGVASDVDLLELERNLRAYLFDDVPRPLAQVAAARVVQRDARYGYIPRVVVASATRRTERP
jgi:hypothetical protein